MNSITCLSFKKVRFLLFLALCLFFFVPVSAAQKFSMLSLGKFSPGTVKLIYNGIALDTYNAYGTNYVAVTDLRMLGFDISYTASSKTVNIFIPSDWEQATTSSGLKLTPSSFSFYNGTVILGNLETQCLVSNGHTFIPVGALRDLGTLTIKQNLCTFVPTGQPPVKATETAIINLTDVPVSVCIIDIYWTDDIVTYPSTFTLLPGETRERTPHTQGNPIHIATLVQGVSGNGIIYTNNSLRGQVNKPLLQKYVCMKDHSFLESCKDVITPEHVIQAEDYVNSKDLSSPTKYLVWTNISKQRTYIFTGSKNNWTLLRSFICSTGRDRTPTPKGTFALTYKVPSFGQAKGYCCKYAFGFIGTDYLYHSIIYDKTGTYLLENKGVLGKKASEGCIRFSTENAKWFYDTLISRTTVYIS